MFCTYRLNSGRLELEIFYFYSEFLHRFEKMDPGPANVMLLIELKWEKGH